MSKGAPDFSATFDIVDDQLQLEEVDRRLQERRSKRASQPKPVVKPEEVEQASANAVKSATRTERKPTKPKRTKGEGAKRVEVVKRKVRKSLTLKVLDETEQRFSQLFHKLQLAGDGRRKQDLADEAFGLLFEKYRTFVGN